MVKKSTGVELPPGPQSILLKMQGSFEAGKLLSPEEVIPAAPKLEGVLAGLPALPKLEEVAPPAAPKKALPTETETLVGL